MCVCAHSANGNKTSKKKKKSLNVILFLASFACSIFFHSFARVEYTKFLCVLPRQQEENTTITTTQKWFLIGIKLLCFVLPCFAYYDLLFCFILLYSVILRSILAIVLWIRSELKIVENYFTAVFIV